MAAPDPSSQANAGAVTQQHLSLDLTVDFDARTLAGTAAWRLAIAPGTPAIHLDTRGLAVESVRLDGVDAAFELQAPPHPVLGARLTVPLPTPAPTVTTLTIDYATTADTPALQWLAPRQTAGGRAPFLFTQCQAIHARSLLPCADTPGVKFTYDARVRVPRGLTAVMSAVPKQEEDGKAAAADTTVFSFTQPVPLSSYLLALAVGDLQKADLSPRIAVWAEPPTLARAAATFGEAETFLAAVERVAGAPYRWTRADMLVLPPSFPYGGMENPCMTFLTPTLLGKPGAPVDTGPASVVAHELAHSVFGNDVSCASWSHFFMNEGWCVWCERKVLGAVRGDAAAALSAAAGAKALAASVRQFGPTHRFTKLVVDLENGTDPDDAFSRVPYEKGCALVTALEKAAGSAAFCAWVQNEWLPPRVGAATTAEDLQAAYTAAFPAAAATIDWHAWLHEPGLPPGFEAAAAEVSAHPAVAAADAAARAWASAAAAGPDAVPPAAPTPADVASWCNETTAYFLDALTDELAKAGAASLPLPLAAALGTDFNLDAATAPEVRAAYLCLAAPSGHPPAVAGAEAMAAEQGRMKYSRPLFRALLAADPARARAVFDEVRERLHPICEKMVAADMKGR